MRSSYLKNHYDDLLRSLTRVYQPKSILEFGILDGVSLGAFLDGISGTNAEVLAFDLFDDFIGNHSNENEIRERFSGYTFDKTLEIRKGDLYDLDLIKELGEQDWDFIHIDCGNHGQTYEFAIQHYLPLVSASGLLLLEGGSVERDQVEWMAKYNKKPIQSVLASSNLKYFTYEPFPGLTMIQP